jgi:hypothetical protein
MSYKIRHNFPIIKTKQYDKFMININTALCFDSNNKAKLKLRVIEFFEEYGIDATQRIFPGISRRSVYRWRKKFVDSGRKLSSLIPRSTRPHRVRSMYVPAKILGFIKTLRKEYPRLSKYKIKVFLDIYCEEQNLPKYSVSWIGKVISRYSFFFNTRKSVKKKRKRAKVTRVKRCPKQKNIKLGYLQLDGIHVIFEGKKYYFLSCIELKTRKSWCKRVRRLNSKNSKIFLEEIIKELSFKIHTIQTDNGSEFKKYFDKAIAEMDKVKHVWSYPRSPKTNGYVERFNRTVQEEYINYEIDVATYNLKLFDDKLNEWLIYYNTVRPHQSLGYKTPNEVLKLLTYKRTVCAKCP